MAIFLEHVRMPVDGESPKILHRSSWSGPLPAIAEFRAIAYTALSSYFKPMVLQVRDELITNLGQPSRVAEAIHMVDSDGSVIASGGDKYYYDLDALKLDWTCTKKNAASILRLLASTDVSIKNVIVQQKALELGIETESLNFALKYAGDQGWIENGLHSTLALTTSGRIRAAEGV